jgi:hypothetical protein
VWFAVSQSDIQSQAELEIFTSAFAALGRHLGHGLSLLHEHDIRRARRHWWLERVLETFAAIYELGFDASGYERG